MLSHIRRALIRLVHASLGVQYICTGKSAPSMSQPESARRNWHLNTAPEAGLCIYFGAAIVHE